MKRIFLVLFLLETIANCQYSFNINCIVTQPISYFTGEGEARYIYKESKATLSSIFLKGNSMYLILLIGPEGKTNFSVSVKNLENINFTYNDNLINFWEFKSIKHSVYENLLKNGYQYDLRHELEEEALSYINTLQNRNLLFNDEYLIDYLNSLINKIIPDRLQYNLPFNLNVSILTAPDPNAFICPNGSMIITTGLLSTINSEDELVAILAHEVSHFILDHHFTNYNRIVEAQKRAEFWANFATTVAAVTEVYFSAKYDRSFGGIPTLTTAVVSHSIADAIAERIGINYTKEQELIADQCATEILGFLGRDTTALASVLTKMKEYYIETGNYYGLYYSKTHPNIDDRINSLAGKSSTKEFHDENYHRKISFVTTYNAIVEFNAKHYDKCLELVNRNIEANVPTENDYIYKAKVIRHKFDKNEKNQEALKCLNIAKSLNINPNIEVYKEEGLILLRLNEIEKSTQAFQKYLTELNNIYDNIDFYKSESLWYNWLNYLTNEIMWTKGMIAKANSCKW